MACTEAGSTEPRRIAVAYTETESTEPRRTAVARGGSNPAELIIRSMDARIVAEDLVRVRGPAWCRALRIQLYEVEHPFEKQPPAVEEPPAEEPPAEEPPVKEQEQPVEKSTKAPKKKKKAKLSQAGPKPGEVLN